ncbi:MAG TPA: hypothetical protein VG711_03070 [Phycisphaerales bacterium]|nr:hypothetical protein [Phycisphaerales bacterium]
MRCLGCRYPLLGLRETTCPECGREFDPKDAETFLGQPASQRAAIVKLSVIMAIYLR